MWSRKKIARALTVSVALAANGFIGGCGFTPIYGEKSAGVTASAALAQVEIAPIPGMVGYYVRNGLVSRIHGNEGVRASHRLDVSLSTGLGGVLVEPDASITRYNYTLSATYQLVDLGTNATVFKGTSNASTGYNVVDSEYATLVSKRDAEKRAAEFVSEEMTLRLALFFNQPNKTP